MVTDSKEDGANGRGMDANGTGPGTDIDNVVMFTFLNHI